MNLRLAKNSLRLRLSDRDIEIFRQNGRIEEKISFGAENDLIFSLENCDAESVSVSFNGTQIEICVPHKIAENLVGNGENGFEAEQNTLKIIVEKDLGRKKPRRESEDSITLDEI